jgi:hypothetical protein
MWADLKHYVFQQDFQEKNVRFLFGKFVLAFQNGSKNVSRNTTNHNGHTNEISNFFYEERCQ